MKKYEQRFSYLISTWSSQETVCKGNHVLFLKGNLLIQARVHTLPFSGSQGKMDSENGESLLSQYSQIQALKNHDSGPENHEFRKRKVKKRNKKKHNSVELHSFVHWCVSFKVHSGHLVKLSSALGKLTFPIMQPILL